MTNASPSLLIVGDTIRSPELRHELPVVLSDTVLFIETAATRAVVVSPLDAPAVRAACPDVGVLDMFADMGMRGLLDAARDSEQALLALWLQACRRYDVTEAAVPPAFPLAVADHLRSHGVRVTVDRAVFAGRRRVKSRVELAGIARAVRAAEAGLAHVAGRLRESEAIDGVLHHDGRPLTSELLRQEIRALVADNDGTLGELVVAHGPQAASGHYAGAGPLPTGVPIVVDLWPQDRASGCYADVARTFLVGHGTEEIRRWHAAAIDARARILTAAGPHVPGRVLWEHACDAIEAAGIATSRTAPYAGGPLTGSPTTLGHGVGLELHEPPTIGPRAGPLSPGDVIAIEPFICHPDVGAVHLEDMIVIEADGAHCLTEAPVALSP